MKLNQTFPSGETINHSRYLGSGENDLYQVHDEVELYGEVNNEENTGPAVLGIRRHHHIRETKKKKEERDREKCELNESRDGREKLWKSPKQMWCGKSVYDELSKEEPLLACHASKDRKKVLHVLLCLLCCGQQDKEADEAVLQSVEVL